MNNIALQLKSKISNLEIKLSKTKNLKTKLDILNEINLLKSELNNLLEIEHKAIEIEHKAIEIEHKAIEIEHKAIESKYKAIESKYKAIVSDKIRDINKQIDKSSRGKFMTDYFYDLTKEILISDSNYIDFINKFWNDKIANLDPSQSVIVRFMVQMPDTSARTLNKTEIIRNTPEDLQSFKEIIKYNLNNIYEHYLTKEEDNMIIGFIMKYKIFSSKKINETITKKAISIKKGRINRTVKIRNINYPLSTNTIDFGDIQYKENGLTYVINTVKNLKYEFERTSDQQIIKVFKEDKLINTIKDYFIDLENNLFKRTYNNLFYWIKDGKVILKSKEYNPKFIKKTFIDKKFTDNIYTGDIETLTKVDNNGKRFFEPYALSYYNGIKAKNYYIDDYNNWKEMMYKYWDDLFNLNFDNTDIYFHNLSGFDAIFILEPILNMEGVSSEIMLRDDKFICITIKKGKSSINIKDSLLILPGSLSNLSKSFKINTPKEIFPRKLFEKETFSADYVSEIVPDYNKYFNKSEVSLEDYNNYCNNFKGKKWSLKDETLKYVDIDCIALYEILIKFGNMIFEKWNIDIKNTPTLPALCFKIYRTKYMPKNTIPIVTGIPYRDIKQSYTGGSTDMYIPYGENIWCYDINSLYPTAMKNFKYPVGKFLSFENLNSLNWSALEKLLNKELFGFLEAKIDCPLSIKHPILQIRREISNNNLRTFSPVGTFTGWFHTEELKEAIKLGYQIEIISGYLFDDAEIFNDYIDDLYKIKTDADKNKDQVWRLISKNLMNSLYGRFGMDQYLINNIVVDKDDSLFNNIIDQIELEDIIEFDSKLLIQALPKNYDTIYYQENLDLNISIPIASSVTAYSRLLMAKYKNNDQYNLHYTDTDSLYISFKNIADKINFESKYVDPLKLGYLKIENLKIEGEFKPYERFYFLGSKFYVGIFDNEIDFSSKTKIRGLQKAYRSMINEKDIKSLLEYNRKPIKIQTMKWYKDLSTSKIIVEHRPYHLDIASSKRSLVYKYISDNNISLINTFPIIMNNNKIEYKGDYFMKDNKIYKEI